MGWIYNPVRLPFTFNNPDILIGRHAVSIDERRAFFRQNLMGSPVEGQDIQQLWFPGVHSDVGGGYPDHTGLANGALQWMLDEAEAAGLLIDPDKRAALDAVPDAADTLHKSLHGAWWILEYWPRRVVSMSHGTPRRIWSIARGRSRRIPAGSLFHPSVYERKQRLGEGYSPPNVPGL